MDRRIIEEKEGWKRRNRKMRTGKLSGWAYIVELGRRREKERGKDGKNKDEKATESDTLVK